MIAEVPNLKIGQVDTDVNDIPGVPNAQNKYYSILKFYPMEGEAQEMNLQNGEEFDVTDGRTIFRLKKWL
jgi:hypothetical protein